MSPKNSRRPQRRQDRPIIWHRQMPQRRTAPVAFGRVATRSIVIDERAHPGLFEHLEARMGDVRVGVDLKEGRWWTGPFQHSRRRRAILQGLLHSLLGDAHLPAVFSAEAMA